ncbi:hypothetical protein [Sphingomonas sp.]|uniref:hypothetical protein n=1 Tax=Sphingomonas sp. TaxID=28214 RepID=UPI0025D18BE5|nr:hypothetical protein [Sphingomonas sp.]
MGYLSRARSIALHPSQLTALWIDDIHNRQRQINPDLQVVAQHSRGKLRSGLHQLVEAPLKGWR